MGRGSALPLLGLGTSPSEAGSLLDGGGIDCFFTGSIGAREVIFVVVLARGSVV